MPISKLVFAYLWLFLFAGNAFAATKYYVSQSLGSDYSNNGLTAATPFKTIQRAADLTNAGDTVFVMNGTYTNACADCDVVNISRAGTASAWIVYTPLAGHVPLISFNGWQGFKLEPTAAYIEINGFTIRGNNANVTLAAALNQPNSCANPSGSVQAIYNGNGIASDGRSGSGFNRPHHLRFVGNTVYECGGAGISTIQSDYVTIENNVVYNNSWCTIYGTSGISCYQNWNYDANTSTYRFIIRNNRTFGNRLYVPWVGACDITDGNGIIIDDSRNTQNGSIIGAYTGKTQIINNLTYLNGGSGIHTYLSDNVDIVNNTAYQNSQSTQTQGEIFANASGNIRILNNIIYPISNEPVNGNYMNTNLTSDYNCYFNTTNITVLGAHDVRVNPQFTNAASADFHLQTTSPCRDAGTSTAAPMTDYSYAARPQGAGYEMGAYELATILPVELLSFSGKNIGEKNLLTWQTASEIQTADFDLESSSDATRFQKITTLKAKGSNSVYEFLDENTITSNIYYRLKINDLDGKNIFSKIILIEKKSVNGKIRIYPNPVADVLNIEQASGERLEIRNVLGQTLLVVQPNTTTIEVAALPSGFYWLAGQDALGVYFSARFFKY